MKAEVIAGLDIGTHSIKMAVLSRREGGELEILGFGEEVSSGVRNGAVVNTEEVSKKVLALNNRIENLVALSISQHQKEHYHIFKTGIASVSSERMREIRSRFGFTKENWSSRRAKSMETARGRIKECVVCSAKITPKNVHQKFCGSACRKEENTRKSTKNYTCELRGKDFIASSYYHRASCSKACASQLTITKRQKKGI